MPNKKLFNLEYTKKQNLFIQNPENDSINFALLELAKEQEGLMVIVTTSNQQARILTKQYESLSQLSIKLFSDWETLPYDNFSPHKDLISNRLKTLYELTQEPSGILIVSITTLMQFIAPKSFLHSYGLIIKNGQKLKLDKFKQQLDNAGYTRQEQVISHGEYAVRGSIIDLFPMGATSPLRLDFFDNEIDSLRSFNPESQLSNESIASFTLLPAYEFPLQDNDIDLFRTNWRNLFPANTAANSIYAQISKGIIPAGIEYWLPLFFKETTSFFDYLPENTIIAQLDDFNSAIDDFTKDINNRYEQRRLNIDRPLLEPQQLWLTKDEIFGKFKQFKLIKLFSKNDTNYKKAENLNTISLPIIEVNHRLKQPLELLNEFLNTFPSKIIFTVQSQGRREVLLELLEKIKVKPAICEDLKSAVTTENKISLIVANCEHGFIYDGDTPFALICEPDLFGVTNLPIISKSSNNKINSDAVIKNLAELKPNQIIVHLEHGIGKYLGLTSIEVGGVLAEYVTLEYRDQAKLYVPVTNLNLVSRYLGGACENISLHKLGSDAWGKTRNKAAEKVRDIAADLLDLYATRALKKGFKFKLDKESYQEFCKSFPFTETPDQMQAINAVLSDMCQGKTMDRLICGDVGFGKTEVAMRAAFLAVNNNKQVAILVPTTLLAEQHYNNFKDRFAQQAIKVEVLSRFKSAKEQKSILADASEGKIDILIGTHKLLQSNIKYKDLGLLIVDEEHRFGVKQKETIKKIRQNVDILTLTATPIPRTLNMAMNGIRDLSIIASPPARRLAIKTFVRQRETDTIKEAISREVMRGGQVFFLHNNVETIDNIATEIQKMVPHARVQVAHGQMRERQLEYIMNDFYHQKFNILVCTTIIETGIDIPTANTIVIDRADKLGLAQLHQLRGRVGRSHHQAYAYLLTPPEQALSKDAVKRLDAISSLEDLGAGFMLATHDLEIRGAGELLGDVQSGQIQSVGFSLYMDMLDQAVEALKNGKKPSLDSLLKQQVELELHLPALLPDDYIYDVNTRLSLYKRLSSIHNKMELNNIKVELIDRFGLLPPAGENLLKITYLKLLAKQLGIKKLDASNLGVQIEFLQNTTIDPMYMVKLLQQNPKRFKMHGPSTLKIELELKNDTKKIEMVEQILNDFSNNLLD